VITYFTEMISFILGVTNQVTPTGSESQDDIIRPLPIFVGSMGTSEARRHQYGCAGLRYLFQVDASCFNHSSATG